MINPFAGIARSYAYVNAQEETVVQMVGDTVRCSLVASKLEDIPTLVESLIGEVRKEPQAQFRVKNHWKNRNLDNIKYGYVGVHIKIRLRVPGDQDRFIVTEVQIHHEAITNGKAKCAKEFTHQIYKPEETIDKRVSEEAVACSRLVFLSSIAMALNSQERQKQVNDQLDQMVKDQNALNTKEIPRVILQTVQLLNYHELNSLQLGSGKFNEKFQAVQPDNPEAITNAWFKAVEITHELLEKKGLTSSFEGESALSSIKNTAKTVDELFSDAQKIIFDFGGICKAAVKRANELKPSANYTIIKDPNFEVIKTDHSLRNKIVDQLIEKTKGQGLLVRCLTAAKDHRVQKTAYRTSLYGGLVVAGLAIAGTYSSLKSARNLSNTIQNGFNNHNAMFHASILNLTEQTQNDLKGRVNFHNLSLDDVENTVATINSLSTEVIACNLQLYEQIRAHNVSMNATAVAIRDASEAYQTTQEVLQRCDDRITPITECFQDINSTLFNGLLGLSLEAQKQFQAKMLLSNISVYNTQKSCTSIVKSLNELFDIHRKYEECVIKNDKNKEAADIAINQTMVAKNETILNLEKHHNETVPLYITQGEHNILKTTLDHCENDKNKTEIERDKFKNENQLCQIQLAVCNTTLSLKKCWIF